MGGQNIYHNCSRNRCVVVVIDTHFIWTFPSEIFEVALKVRDVFLVDVTVCWNAHRIVVGNAEVVVRIFLS